MFCFLHVAIIQRQLPSIAFLWRSSTFQLGPQLSWATPPDNVRLGDELEIEVQKDGKTVAYKTAYFGEAAGWTCFFEPEGWMIQWDSGCRWDTETLKVIGLGWSVGGSRKSALVSKQVQRVHSGAARSMWALLIKLSQLFLTRGRVTHSSRMDRTDGHWMPFPEDGFSSN